MATTSSTRPGDERPRAVGRPGPIRAPERSPERPSGRPAAQAAAEGAPSALRQKAERAGDDRGEAGAAFPIDVAIADKSPLILAGLEALLADDRRFNLVLKVTDGEEFLDAAKLQRFQIAIIGWQLPTLHAREVLRALSRQPSAPKIVVYSGTNDPAAPAETLQLGGAGFVSKRAPPERLLDVLASVAAGDMVFPFVDIRKMRADPLENLTLRERSLLSALGSGHTNNQLAKDFGVSINTIKFHLRNLFEKLEVRNRAQAIALFLEMKHGSWSAATPGGRAETAGARGKKPPRD
ncbi:response regulator transcription factor [Methylosinus sporium]|uniref:Response regulator transcription factor n=1 Tax=Methylosinus sporium TaxID=428 RepID=A0A549T4E9_METSR|nr:MULTISPECIES: response regulator transcription factor [Methylosinus]MBU3889541.1 response regulator transcription factor [Methylosinus sp. KRF6]TRL36776.1 response regulator transcription factor [Methylosinus sporium]